MVNVNVYGAQEFDQQGLVIRPDGYITVNPLGEMKASGMDIQGLSDLLEQQLKHYLKNPEVSITISKFHPAIVYVLGAVQKPGAYEIHNDIDRPDSPSAHLVRGTLTVSNLIANAGGITQQADLTQVSVENNETHQKQTVNMIDLLKKGDISQDLMVNSGDTVYVPDAGKVTMDDETYKMVVKSALSSGAINVRVIGKVNTPGVYSINPQTPGINSAIASAHGYLIEANQHTIKVLRIGSDGQLSAMTVNPSKTDLVMRDNDVIVVDERVGPKIGRGFDYTTRLLAPFVSVASFTNSILDIFDPKRFYYAPIVSHP
jgi:polysaccharide export outer membrane protein